MILELIAEAVRNGARLLMACKVVGLSKRTIERWRGQEIGDDRRAGAKHEPANKLSLKEREAIIAVLTSTEYRDLSPRQVVPKLADQGIYLGSESTFYRLLHERNMQVHRSAVRESTRRYRPKELVATGPNQVWSWDITYVATPTKGLFHYTYMVVDVFSRKIVGYAVHDCECGDLAANLIEQACRDEGVSKNQVVLHSDNGAPMKSATLLATLQQLGVVTSFSRPRVSNDNPISEALFRTVKYRPEYPKGSFKSLEDAQKWFAWFVAWYNEEHQHSGIRFVTPAQRHSGADREILRKREEVYAAAKKRRPNRWSGATRDWSRIEEVRLNKAPNKDVAMAA